MKGKIISDWSKLDLSNEKGQELFKGAIQHFLVAPEKNPKLKAAIRHFATKGDFPAEVLEILEKYHATSDFDLGYEEIFDIRDYTGSTESGFKILDVTSGLTFAKVESGGKAKVFKFSGEATTVSFDRYGGALQWDRTLFDDKEYWTLEDNAIAFRNKAYAQRSQAFYDLIEAVPDTAAQNVDWAAPVPSALPNTDATYVANRDSQTIATAAEEILIALKDAGMEVNANSPFILLAPVQLRDRITRAIALLSQPVAGAPTMTQYNIRPIYTLMLSASDKYYVVLPKRKMKGGYRMDLTLFADFNVLAYADLVAGWQRYGAAIADTDQVRRCSIA